MTDTTGPTMRSRRGTGNWRDRGWKQLSLRIPPDLHARLQTQADAATLPDIDYVRQALIEKLERDEKAQQ